jgi:glycerophosphoryl diester phosphodiesterase
MSDVLSWIRLPGPLVIGHRGFPEAARENTLAAFEAALEAGCDGVELDVHVTRDGVPVVHHDPAAATAEGSLEIAAEPWSALASARFLGPEGTYPLERLDLVVDALSGRALVNVELKSPPARAALPMYLDAVVPVLDRIRPRESLLVSSFDAGLLGSLYRRDRSLALGFLFSALRDLNHLEEFDVVDVLTALHPRHDLVDPKLLRRARERSLAVCAWTVDDVEKARRLVEMGVHAVITNRPDQVSAGLLGA